MRRSEIRVRETRISEPFNFCGDLMIERPIAIIGAGIVGTAVAGILESKTYNIAAVSSRSQESLDRAGAYVSAPLSTDPAAAARGAQLIIITTPDDMIQSVCETIAAEGGFSPGDIVLHMSGALQLSVLTAAEEAGALTGSIHPMQTFADIDGAIASLPGTIFGVTAVGEALAAANEIVEALGGEPYGIEDADKPIYHAAACAVSNYLVALMDYAESLYGSIGLPAETARKAYLPLLRGTVANIARKGPAGALTGPISRGDVGTVRRHVEAINVSAPWAGSIYGKMGVYTIGVALKKGTISDIKAEELGKILEFLID